MRSNFLFLSILAFLIFNSSNSFSQEDALLVVEGEKITKTEFENVYKKNNTKNLSFAPADVEEYLQLYINYKLKVKEAESLKMDTISSFVKELAGYRKQLAQPYMNDKEVTERLVKEAYDRLLKDVRASHVLIQVEFDALPKDTLAAFEKAMKVRKRLVKGADFAAVAREVSDDPSAKQNGGDLGFFTGLQMVYPFETAAYETPLGEISKPVRTRFGYHIIKKVDERTAVGEIQVKHIMVKSASTDPDSIKNKAVEKINEIYAELEKGSNWDDLCEKFSDDKGSARSGGLLPWFGTGKMVPEFEKVAFKLEKNEDYSKPVQTTYGWHIIKRNDKREISPFEDKEKQLRNQVARDSRAEASKRSLIRRIQNDYKFKEQPANREAFINSCIDSTLLQGGWTADKAKGFDKELFSIGDDKYTQSDFAQFVQKRQTRKGNTTAIRYANQLYSSFVDDKCLVYEEAQLENKYPDFKALMQEYRDGILLFDLTDKLVWSKAVKDTAGLKKFYEKNVNSYMWGQRVDAEIYTCANAEIAASVKKLAKKGKKSTEEIIEITNEKSQLNLSVKKGIFSRGDDKNIDIVSWEKGISENLDVNNAVVFVKIKEVLEPMPKTLREAKGLVTADYQNHLEKEWIKELRAKYKVEINRELLTKVGQ